MANGNASSQITCSRVSRNIVGKKGSRDQKNFDGVAQVGGRIQEKLGEAMQKMRSCEFLTVIIGLIMHVVWTALSLW